MANGLLNNPLLALGQGLLSASGPSLDPGSVGLGQGLSRGLNNILAQRQAQQQAQLQAARLQQVRAQMQQAQAERQAELETARRRREAEGLLVSQAPPEQQDLVRGLLGTGQEDAAAGLLQPQPEEPGTAGLKEYAAAVEQGFKGTFIEYKAALAQARGPSEVDRLAGLLAQGKVDDAELKRQEQARKLEEARRKEERKLVEQGQEFGTTIEQIDKAIGKVSDLSTGMIAQLTRGIKSSPAGELELIIQPIVSKVALDRIAAMKAMSATGATGFGALSQNELNLLTGALGSLDTARSADGLRDALQAVRTHYTRWQQLAEQDLQRFRAEKAARDAAAGTGGAGSAAGAPPTLPQAPAPPQAPAGPPRTVDFNSLVRPQSQPAPTGLL